MKYSEIRKYHHFETFRELSAWTDAGKSMLAIHATVNGERPYMNPRISYSYLSKERMTPEVIGIRLVNSEFVQIPFNFPDSSRSISFLFSGKVALMEKVTDSGYVLKLVGHVERGTNDGVYKVPVAMACFYETRDVSPVVNGFALLPSDVSVRLGGPA